MKSHPIVKSLLVLATVLNLVTNSASQIAGGMNETTATGLGGNNFIAGIVFSPYGTPINVRMRIRLTSPTAGEYIITTDDRGQFVFSGLVAGNYIVSIDNEKDYHSISQNVDITLSRGRQTYNISIHLVENRKVTAKPSVVNKAALEIPKKARTCYQKALKLSNDGNYTSAIEQLELALRAYPDFTMAYNEIAVQYLKLNDLEKAKEALQTALNIDSEAFEPMVNYGIVLFRLKKFPESEIALRKVLKLKDSPVGFYYLGRTLTALERFDDAETAFLTSIKLGDGEMKEAHRMLANVYINKSDNQRAIEQLTIYLELVPNAPDAPHLKQVLEQLKN